MELDILQIANLFVVFVSFLLAFYLITAKSKNYLSNVLIAIFLILNAIDTSSDFVSELIYPSYPGLGLLISTTVFLQIPTLYLYILSTIYSDFKLNKKDLLHLIPFAFVIILFIPSYYSQNVDTKLQYIEDAFISGKWEVTFTFIFENVQVLFYLILSFIAVKKYKQLLLENYSNASMFHYQWLFQLISIYAFITLIDITRNLFMFMDIDYLFFYTRLLGMIVMLSFISWILLKALRAPELFRGISSDLSLVSQQNPNIIQQDSDKQRILAELDQFMKEKKPYLNASLTVFDLANELDYSKQDLSLLINKELNQHFFDFVNGYRIRLAMEILQDPSKKELTVLEILYEVGFNSKSSFNTAFKKLSNCTPTDYRKKYLPS